MTPTYIYNMLVLRHCMDCRPSWFILRIYTFSLYFSLSRFTFQFNSLQAFYLIYFTSSHITSIEWIECKWTPWFQIELNDKVCEFILNFSLHCGVRVRFHHFQIVHFNSNGNRKILLRIHTFSFQMKKRLMIFEKEKMPSVEKKMY